MVEDEGRIGDRQIDTGRVNAGTFADSTVSAAGDRNDAETRSATLSTECFVRFEGAVGNRERSSVRVDAATLTNAALSTVTAGCPGARLPTADLVGAND